MEGASLSVHDLACRRGDRLLFRGLSFELAPGEVLQVAGANGTGKSSLLRIVAGLLRPFEGRVTFAGSVGLLDERLPLDEHLPLGQAFAVWNRLSGGVYSPGAFASVGLDGLRDVPVRYLSTGQRKRLALVVAYLEDRPFYLFDEWAADQDPSFKAVFYEQLLPELRARGKAVIVITHDDRYFGLADRLLKLDNGQIVSDTTPARSQARNGVDALSA